MKYFVILIISLITLRGNSQELTGKIYNSETEKSISYVNIGVIGENIGTVSDINGKFRLKLAPHLTNDSLLISCIGFHSKSYLINDLINNSANKNSLDIDLKPVSYKIGEVNVKGVEPKLRTLGNPIRDNDNIRIRTDSLLGSEIGLVIRVPRKNRKYKLKDFTFNLVDHDFEKEIRVNIYNLIDSKPSENILLQPIYFSIPSNRETLTIDLTEYNIIVDHDFFISIENFKGIPSMDKRLKFNGVYGLGNSKSYFRKVSQGKWEKMPLVSIQFNIIAYEYPK